MVESLDEYMRDEVKNTCIITNVFHVAKKVD